MNQHHGAKVSTPMHYAVVIALMVSLITSCLLGILLTQAVFGQGLNYFSRLREHASISKSYAATLQPVVTKRQYVTHTLTSEIKTLPSYDYDQAFLKEHGIAIGTPFTLQYTYDPSTAVDQMPDDPSFAVYHFTGPITFTAGTLRLVSNGFQIRVGNDVDSGGEYGVVDFYRVTVDPFTYDGYEITWISDILLGDTSLIASDKLVEQFDPAKFTVANLSGIIAQGWPVHDLGWAFGGPATSHARTVSLNPIMPSPVVSGTIDPLAGAPAGVLK